MFDEHLHPFDGIHVAAGVNIYGTRSLFRERMDANVGFSKRIHNRDTLRMKLVRESVENRGSANFDGTFECRFDSWKIIQKME